MFTGTPVGSKQQAAAIPALRQLQQQPEYTARFLLDSIIE